MSEARSVLRLLLRTINANVTSVTGNQQWRQHAVKTFREQSSQNLSPEQIAASLQRAKDYAFMLESIRDHQKLLLSYNIGIDVESREKNMNRRAANLVGLSMPEPQQH